MIKFLLSVSLSLFFAVAAASPIYGPDSPDYTKLPPRESCWITQARVNDPQPPLRLRSAPENSPDNILQTLPNGTWLSVLGENAGWLKVKIPGHPELAAHEGWVAASRTDYACNYFTETVAQFPFSVATRIVGGGSHQYIVSLAAGQSLILRPAQSGEATLLWPTSVISLETGKPVPHSPNNYNRWWSQPQDRTSSPPAAWIWKADQPGLYAIQYDSNFRGFAYGFTLELTQDTRK